MESIVIVGAGPAGLTAAHELTRLGHTPVLFEKDSQVGGISRTVEYQGYRFDIGGHRFFTKSKLVQETWEEMLGDDLLERPRLSRIFYDGKFFDYPLKPWNALTGLGPFGAFRVGYSYIWSQVAPYRDERNFEQWVCNRFGRRLFEIFFKTYTEKVWGMPCAEISADWAAQRIKDLDLLKAVRNSLIGQKGSGEVLTTLIDRFHYPRLGPGMMWERCLERVRNKGVEVSLDAEVHRLMHRGGRIEGVEVRFADDRHLEIAAHQVISSMPLSQLIASLDPEPPQAVRDAAKRLRFRDFLTVVLIVDREFLFPDNWIYIHAPEVAVGRIQNFKNWSPEMVPDQSKTALGLEYFVNEGDELWSADDDDLVELGTKEMARLGLVDPNEVVGGTVVRMLKAYPVYDDAYQDCVAVIREYLAGLPNLQTIGRNGQHRYNNQDHSMLAGMFSARNLTGSSYDLWSINAEQEYHEEVAADAERPGDRLVPAAAEAPSVAKLIEATFARYDSVALATALGTTFGLGLFLATAVLLLRGGDNVGPMLSLLGQYLFGYEMTWPGAFVGSLEAGVIAFALGFVMSTAINLLIGIHERSALGRLELERTLDPLTEGDI